MRPEWIVPLLLPSQALAHGGHAVTPANLLAAWRPDPLLAALLLAAAFVYGRGLLLLWSRAGPARGVSRGAVAAFAAGLAVLALALLSPIETAGGALLSAHMLQHVLLVALAPPLLLAGRPDVLLVFALPIGARGGVSAIGAGLRRLARPLPASLLHAAAIWAWHAPGLFQAAIASDMLHHFEHASFLFTALLFWQSLFTALRSPSLRLAASLATLFTLIQSGLLGALLTLSPRPLYPAGDAAAAWGLTALQDQQLAGLVMWVPMGAVYLAAALALAAKMLGADEPPGGATRVGARSQWQA